MRGLELSEKFFHEVVYPILQTEYQALLPMLAIGFLGSGSEILGFDDELSQDHNFSPRVHIFVTEPQGEPFMATIRQTIIDAAPAHYLGFALQQDEWLAFVQVTPLEAFFLDYLQMRHFPQSPQDWLKLDEQKLLELTAGKVFFDPQGRLQQMRERLDAYPDVVRYFLLYQGFVRLSEVGAIERTVRRGDPIATALYQAFFIYFAIKVLHLYKRRYCPYKKWMGHHLQYLGDEGRWLKQAIETMLTGSTLQQTREDVIAILTFLGGLVLGELDLDATELELRPDRLQLIPFAWDPVLSALKAALPVALLELPPVITPQPWWGLLFDMEGLGSSYQATLEANLDFLRQE